MQHFLPKLRSHWPLLGIFIVWLAVVMTNYTPGTLLTGWDNLHPEFNFKVNIYRSFQAVWQEYQGLGLLGGMAHAADLPRQLFLLLLSTFIPTELLRYVFHFLMLLVGMVGMYFLLSLILLRDAPQKTKSISSLAGSLFYLLNLGTIQYFFVPFEPYSMFWGMFPWEILVLLLYLAKPSKKNLVLLIVVNAIAIPQAYVQTIFLVYLICIGIILAVTFYKDRTKSFLRQAAVILGTIFVINAFWLLPNLYFVTTNLSVTQDAIQNQLATEKFFQMNKNRGTIQDLPLLQEFYFDFFDYDEESGQFEYMMGSWRDHFATIPVQVAGYSLFLLSIVGVVMNRRFRSVFISLAILCVVVFLSNTPPFSFINAFFREIPILNQILRNPFTKFIVPLVAIYAIGVGLGLAYLISKFTERKGVSWVVPLLVFVFIGVISYPVLKGEFIARTMRVTIPTEYYQLFDYFEDKDKSARIMNLPQGSFWGWYYYRFGARGSGFLWYGIEQPIVDRAFDVWSRNNEDYYWELTFALQRRDQTLFNNILDKYHIKYILLDNNILFADNINSVRYALNQEELVENNSKMKKVAVFGEINVYEVTLTNEPKNNVIGSTIPITASNKGITSSRDEVYQAVGMYKSSAEKDAASLLFPFGSLFTSRLTSERSFTSVEKNNNIEFGQSIPQGTYSLTLPSSTENATIIPVAVTAKSDGRSITLRLSLVQPTVQIGEKILTKPQRFQEITLPTPAANRGDYFLSINNTDFFSLTGISETYKAYGTTYLTNADNANYVRLYTSSQGKKEQIALTNFEPAKLCGAENPNSAVSTKIDGNTMTLQAKNTANCTVSKTPFTGFEKSLIKVAFIYTSSSDEYPQYCYYSESARGCLNKKDYVRTGFSEEKAGFEDYFESSESASDSAFFHAILEAQSDEDKEQTKSITYEGIIVQAFPYVTGQSLVLEGLQDAPEIASVNLEKTTTLSVKVPKLLNAFSYVTPIKKQLYKKSPLNYDTVLPGRYVREEIETDPKMLQASAQQASSYILLRATNLPASTGYFVSLSTVHKEGFPFTVNIFTNQEFRSYVYSYASDEKGQHTDHFVLPPLYPYDKGIAFLLGSNSYNSTPSTNSLIDISAYPIPYDFITKMKVQKTGTQVAPIKSTPLEVTKISLSKYIVTPNEQAPFITLSQGFDSGWQAYQLTSDTTLGRSLPWLLGSRLEHVEVNGWANGWTVSQNKKGPVVILYLPQYLEGLGILLGITSLGLFLIISLRPRLKRKS